MTNKKIIIGAAIIAALFVIGAFAFSGNERFGGFTNLDGLILGEDGLQVSGPSTFTGSATFSASTTFSGGSTITGTTTLTGGLQVGSLGTVMQNVVVGKALCPTGIVSIPGVSFATVNCVATGVRGGDTVLANVSSTTPGWVILAGTYASSTANDFFQLRFFNSSTSAISIGLATTSIPYISIR